METYYVYDLARIAPGAPGEVVRIRVRARDEVYARHCAAAHRGNESDAEWQDPTKSTASRVCEAAVQWSGVVRVLGFEHTNEKARVTRARIAGARPVPPPEVDLHTPVPAIGQDTEEMDDNMTPDPDPEPGDEDSDEESQDEDDAFGSAVAEA